MAWHRHTSPTNFIIQQSRSFEGVRVPLRLTNCLFPVPDSQPTETELSSRRCTDLEQSSAAYHACSVTSRLLLSLEDMLLRTSNSVIRNYCCRAREVTLSFMDALIALAYLLTFLLTLDFDFWPNMITMKKSNVPKIKNQLSKYISNRSIYNNIMSSQRERERERERSSV